MGICPEQAGFDAAELALLAIAEAHRRLLTCGLLRDAAPAYASRLRWGPRGGVSARGWPGRGSGCGPWGRGQGPRACGQRAARRTVARPASASTMRYPPETMLDQYIGVAMENLASRMNGEMITHTPSSTLANCSPAKPRGPTSEAAPTAATASPAIRFATAALPPPCCSVRNDGDRAIHSPVSTPSAAIAWTAMPRMVAGSRYSVTAAMVTAA